MNPHTFSGKTHPDLRTLALSSGGDLPLTRSLPVRWHLYRCAVCREHVQSFRKASASLKDEVLNGSLAGLEYDWARLEREMLGNIAVGVAAARCIEKVGRQRFFLRTGWLIAALSVLFVIGWFTHIPPEQNARLLATLQHAVANSHPVPMTELKSTPDGIAVRTQGATLTLIHPGSAVVSLSGSSAVTARYLDEDTGQVTITKVYAQ